MLWVRPPQYEMGTWLLAYFLDGVIIDWEEGPWRRSMTLEMVLDELRESTAIKIPRLIEQDRERREALLEQIGDDLEALIEASQDDDNRLRV